MYSADHDLPCFRKLWLSGPRVQRSRMQRYADVPWLSSHAQGNDPQTHLNHDEHVKEIEKGRDYLLEAWFSQDNSSLRVATNIDNLSKKKHDVSIVRQARRVLDVLPSDSQWDPVLKQTRLN
jgi:hypothetical protein